MRLINAVMTALVVTAGYYGFLYFIDIKYELLLGHKDKWIADKTVFFIGGLTLAGVLAVGYVRLPGLSFTGCLLTTVLFWGLAVLAVTDIKKQLIPNRILLGLLALWIAAAGITIILDTEAGIALLFRSLVGALAGGIIFLLCYLLSKGQMGAGDVKLAFVMGLYLTGERIIGGIFYGTLLCALYSIVQLCRKKLTLKNGVPMAPFLYAGVFVTFLIM